jgi:hypothetical protein
MYKTKFRQRLCRNRKILPADFADEMKLSKATVSRLARQMIKAGKIIKKSVSLCRAKLSADVDGAERAARTNVRFHGNTAEHG